MGKPYPRGARPGERCCPGRNLVRSAITLPVLSVRTGQPAASKIPLSASPRRASPDPGAGISVSEICWLVTQLEFLSIQASARRQAGSSASLRMGISVAREEDGVAIKIKIQEMPSEFHAIRASILIG